MGMCGQWEFVNKPHRDDLRLLVPSTIEEDAIMLRMDLLDKVREHYAR